MRIKVKRQMDNEQQAHSKLAPCPRAAICVSTESKNPNRRMEPIKYHQSLYEAKQLMLEVLKTLPKTTIVKVDENYIHAHCKTAIFAFTDDVEFYFDDQEKLIHFRSASSGGVSDFGSNKRRMQAISARFIRAQNHLLNS